jgi:antitoxin component YwqK of YwqJK toxin-antitoxin module/Tfp pilus assembly protein PilF
MKKLLLLVFIGCLSNAYAQTDYSFIYDNHAIVQKGIALYDAEKYADAIKEYDKIDKLDPKYLTAQYEKAMTLSALDKPEDTRPFFENIYKSGKMQELPAFYTIYGSFLSDQKEYDQAEKIFKEGEKYMSNSANFLYNFAIVYVRKEDNQKAVELLQRAVIANPNHASSHYLLGILAFEDGRITEGTLALLSYLAIVPTGKFAEKAVLRLNEKFGQNYMSKSKLVFSKSGDNFEEIETILRNQLPLKSAYKIKSEIDDVITRQVQAVAEYTTEHKMGEGFFENTYLPWIKDMVEKKQFEAFSYYILLSMEEKIGKKLTSQKKKILAFDGGYMTNDFWKIFAKRKVADWYGKPAEVTTIFKNNIPYLVGPVVDGKKEGTFKYLNEDGNMEGELQFKDNELNGIQKYYDDKGKLSEEKSFLNGNADGTRISYYSNGAKDIIENYKNDKLHGISTNFYVNGGRMYEVNFVDGERDGKFTGLYPNGTKKLESNYMMGKLNGQYSSYNEVGDLTETYNNVDGEIDGKYVEYFDGKTIKAEATYSKGKVQGTTKKYYSNGVVEKENVYANGKITKSTEYFANGNKDNEYFYNDKEELETLSSYDSNGNKYYDERYTKGDIKAGTQYLKTSPKPIEMSASKKPFTMNNYEGVPVASGEFEKGKKVKEWTYRYPSGIVRMKQNYTKGNQDGLTYTYNRSGQQDAIINYVNDTINGLYEVYENGKLDRTFYYIKGKQNGPFKTYYVDGALSTEGYIVDGDVNYEKRSHWQSGAISSIDMFIGDELINSETYNNKGEKDFTTDYNGKTGKFTQSYSGGVFTQDYEMVNGKRNGKSMYTDKLKTLMTETNWVNGVRHNVLKSYSPMGTIESERTYYCGDLIGIDKEYDLVGTLKYQDENMFGTQHGKTIRYYHNKSKMAEYSEMSNHKNGDYTYYNQKGEAILIVNFADNNVMSYTALKAGALTDKHDMVDQTANIVSNYANGKPAIKMNFIKGNLEGKVTIFSNEGKVEFESEYVNNILNGNRVEYYANGKVYKKEHFTNENYDGLQEYFSEDGKPIFSAEYKNDELHGNALIYANGVLSITKKYDSNELVEIIKK